jgi:hypothetical protein
MISNPFAPNDFPGPPEGFEEEEKVNNSTAAGKQTPAEQGLEIPAGWKPTVSEPVPVVRCHGTSSTTGERCNRWSLRGTTVCRKHGAQLQNVRDHAEAVVESARLELMGMADDAVEVLRDLIKPGVADAVRLKAVENILNRSGIKDAVDMNITVTSNSTAAEDIQKKLAVMAERMVPKADPEDLGEVLDEPEDLPDEPIHEAPEKITDPLP